MAQSKIDSNPTQWMDPETGSTFEQKWAEEGSEAQVGGAFFILGILGVVATGWTINALSQAQHISLWEATKMLAHIIITSH